MGEALPEFLTVEEAAALLRIGRTKAYALAKQWRDTNGRTGLPVIDFGDCLRVRRAALDSALGGWPAGMPVPSEPTSAAVLKRRPRRPAHQPSPEPRAAASPVAAPAVLPAAPLPQSRRSHPATTRPQPSLFDPDSSLPATPLSNPLP
jgi:hypothetical protein